MKPKLSQVDLSAGTGGQILAADAMKLKAVTPPSVSDADYTKLYAEKMYDENLKLLSNFEGADAATTIKDESERGNYISFYNHTKIKTTTAKFGNSSILFDGTDDYLGVQDSDNWNFGTGDFTIEGWFNFSGTGEQTIMGQYQDANNRWRIEKDATTHNLLMIFVSGGTTQGYYYMTSAWGSFATGTWFHLAYIRNGSNAYIFINGVSQTLTTFTSFSTNNVGNIVGPLYMGQTGASTLYFNGYMDEIRISKGIARWTSNFTSPTSAYTTDSYTKLLLHAEGLDSQTSTLDSSECGHPIVFINHAQIDTAQYKFGSSSLLLDGTDDYLQLSGNGTDWQIWANATSNYTIDFWIKFNSLTGSQFLFSQYTDASNRWYLYHNDSNGFYFYCKSGGTDYSDTTASGGKISDTNWHHVALIKVADKWAIYLDGQQVHYGTWTGYATQTGDFYVGRDPAGTGSYFNGWMDGIRIIKSNPFQAAPQSDKSDTITIPTEAFTGGNKAELKVRDEEGNITVLSPHNFSIIPEGKSEEMAFSYYSEKNNKIVNVDLLKAVRLVEELTNEKLVYIKNKKTGEIS